MTSHGSVPSGTACSRNQRKHLLGASRRRRVLAVVQDDTALTHDGELAAGLVPVQADLDVGHVRSSR